MHQVGFIYKMNVFVSTVEEMAGFFSVRNCRPQKFIEMSHCKVHCVPRVVTSELQQYFLSIMSAVDRISCTIEAGVFLQSHPAA